MCTLAGLTKSEIIPVLTKRDLEGTSSVAQSSGRTRAATVGLHSEAISVHTGIGLESLAERIRSILESRQPLLYRNQAVLTRARHVRAVKNARAAIDEFMADLGLVQLPLNFAAARLHVAADALLELCGAIGAEEVLEQLFADFCVGK